MQKPDDTMHYLNSPWTIWTHLPHDVDWSIKSYNNLYQFNTQEETIELTKNLPENFIKNSKFGTLEKTFFIASLIFLFCNTKSLPTKPKKAILISL